MECITLGLKVLTYLECAFFESLRTYLLTIEAYKKSSQSSLECVF
jgi:hypothetical protein